MTATTEAGAGPEGRGTRQKRCVRKAVPSTQVLQYDEPFKDAFPKDQYYDDKPTDSTMDLDETHDIAHDDKRPTTAPPRTSPCSPSGPPSSPS